ncbi:MAG TPA: hypothetical protein VKX25_19300 [Bryobacteraceae bacterium]|nr:hypothetical protein [Bryobacteraceae bacterium]
MKLEWGKTEVLLALSRSEWDTLFRLLVIGVKRASLQDMSIEECRRAKTFWTRLSEEYRRVETRLKAAQVLDSSD